MKYYSFDAKTKEFMGAADAMVNPKESDIHGKTVYLLPANAAWQMPEADKDGFAQVWNGSKWEYVPDFRGRTVWKSYDDCMTITELGDIPDGYSLTRPKKVLTVADYDLAMEKYLYDTRVARGYTAREPDFYLNSTVARWAQDAADWVKFRDEVMLYALEVQNSFAATGNAPAMAEFLAAMPEINWSYGK